MEHVEYPFKMFFSNNTGKDVEFNFFRDSEEVADAIANPGNYADISGLDGSNVSEDKILKSTIFRIKGIVAGTATSDLDVLFLQYHRG